MASEALTPSAVNRWVLLVCVMFGGFMMVLDNNITSVSLPYIMATLGADIEQVQWVASGFMIAATASMPLTHWLGRRLGYGNLYIYALMAFTAGAALSASSWSLETLIVARVLQGVGSGVVQPTGITLLTRAFPRSMRGRALGFNSVGVMLAPTFGPTLAGVLIDLFGWRANYTMSTGVGLLALLLASSVLSREKEEPPGAFDWWGYFSLIILLVCGLLTVANGPRVGWGEEPIVLGMAVAATALMVLLVVEWQVRHPILPIHLLRVGDLSLALFLTLYKALARLGGNFLLPIFLSRVQNRNPVEIGLLMMPGPIWNSICNPIAGLFTDKVGGKWLAVASGFAIGAYLWLYHGLDPLSTAWAIVMPQFFRGLGIAMIDAPVVTTGMNAVPRDETSNASWMFTLMLRIGSVLSISMMSTYLQRQISVQREHLAGSPLGSDPPAEAWVRENRRLGLTEADARSAARSVANRQITVYATARAFQNLYVVAGLVGLSAVIPALFLRGRRTPPPARAAAA